MLGSDLNFSEPLWISGPGRRTAPSTWKRQYRWGWWGPRHGAMFHQLWWPALLKGWEPDGTCITGDVDLHILHLLHLQSTNRDDAFYECFRWSVRGWENGSQDLSDRIKPFILVVRFNHDGLDSIVRVPSHFGLEHCLATSWGLLNGSAGPCWEPSRKRLSKRVKESCEDHDIFISYHITLWLFNIAMENSPFIDGLPIKNGDFPWLC
jgi:hypothetical protein